MLLLSLPLIVSGEYRFGLMGSKKAAELEALLIILEQESKLLTIDIETTKSYAHIRHELKSAVTPIPENDVWIAALARQHNLPVVSRDRHFDAVKAILRIAW
jgi:predicted nucleic acid-binding protein